MDTQRQTGRTRLRCTTRWASPFNPYLPRCTSGSTRSTILYTTAQYNDERGAGHMQHKTPHPSANFAPLTIPSAKLNSIGALPIAIQRGYLYSTPIVPLKSRNVPDRKCCALALTSSQAPAIEHPSVTRGCGGLCRAGICAHPTAQLRLPTCKLLANRPRVEVQWWAHLAPNWRFWD